MVNPPFAITFAAAVAISPLILLLRLSQRLRLVKMDSFWHSILWSLRLSRSTYSFPATLEQWSIRHMPTEQEYLAMWGLLRPFFLSRGYTLYLKKLGSSELFPSTRPAVASRSVRCHPYSRTLNHDEDFSMLTGVNYIYGARDKFERDVIIKIVSEADNPSNEWKILQKFNGKDLRQNPANRIIHVIEFIKFDRWDTAFTPPFLTVAELMDVTKACLETMNYLHIHRIAHQDFSLGNLGMNLYATPVHLRNAAGVRDPREVQYALYDFGHSLLYPKDTNIDTVKTSRRLRYYHAPDPIGDYNPFKSDVAMMGGLLHGHHAAAVVPEIERLFDHMTELDENMRPSAYEALESFTKLYERLTADQLQTQVDCHWTNAFWPKHLPEPEYD